MWNYPQSTITKSSFMTRVKKRSNSQKIPVFDFKTWTTNSFYQKPNNKLERTQEKYAVRSERESDKGKHTTSKTYDYGICNST